MIPSTFAEACRGLRDRPQAPRLGLTGCRLPQRRRRFQPCLEALEDRTLLAVNLLSHYTGINFSQSGGFIPPDTDGAAGTSNYVETTNQTISIYTPKTTGATSVRDRFSDFWFSQGGLPRADAASRLSDPIVVWDDQIQRFIVGDQDVNFNTHVSRFDIAVSRSASPATLTPGDWRFYSIVTTEAFFDADYPGNFGYNHDAFVFTLNMLHAPRTAGTDHVLVTSISISDLVAGAASPATFRNDLFSIFPSTISFRPTVMHDSAAGDPMWLIAEGPNPTIDVCKMTVLSPAPGFAETLLPVNRYSTVVPPLQPDGTALTTNLDSRILKAAEFNRNIVATHMVSPSPNEDDARWYRLDVSSGTPMLVDQGNVSAGPNTYLTYPGIDINPSGAIGMSTMKSGTGAGQFLSVYVTGRLAGDAAGTMETSVLVQPGAQNYHDFGSSLSGQRAGDLSGINVDSDGSFWIANEFADNEPPFPAGGANWGTAIAHFALGTPPPPPPASPLWSTVAPMHTARAYLAGATGTDGRIYAIGGQNSSGTLNTVEAYSPGPNFWSTRASMPTARYGLAAAAGADGRIYAVGGSSNGSNFLNTVEAYSPSTNTWTTMAHMNTPRFAPAGAAGSDGRIYAAGGQNGSSFLKTVEAYRPGLNIWSPVASMSTAREGAAAAAGADGRIYVFGGFDGSSILNTVEAYNPSTNIWTTVAQMSTPRLFPAAAPGVNGRLYVFGGLDSSGNILNTVESYNPSSNSWSAVAPMPTARAGLAAALGVNGRLYAFGGFNNSGFLNTEEALQVFSGLFGAAASRAKSPTLVSADPTSSTVTAATPTVTPLQGASNPWAVQGDGGGDTLRDRADIVFAKGADTLSDGVADSPFAGGIG